MSIKISGQQIRKFCRIKAAVSGKNLSGGIIMAENITAKELTMLSQALTTESLICKKARMYSNTLTDQALYECMAAIADEHEKRCCALMKLLG